MASSLLTASLTSPPSSSSSSKFPFCPKSFSNLHLPNPLYLSSTALDLFPSKSKPLVCLTKTHKDLAVNAQTLGSSGSLFEGGFGSEDDPPSPPGPGLTAVEYKEEPQCPPGLRQYETMAILRLDMSEDERLSLTHK